MLKIGTVTRLATLGIIPRLLLSQGSINIGLGTFGVLYNLYLSAAGESLAFIGTFNALSILALGISAVPIGAGARLISHRLALSFGTLLLMVVQVALALSTRQAALLAAGVLSGIAQALTVVPVGPMISDRVPRGQRAVVFGRLYATWALATGAGSILGGALPGMLAGMLSLGSSTGLQAYRAALLVSVITTFFGWLLLLRSPEPPLQESPESRVDVFSGVGWAFRTERHLLTAVVITVGLFSFAVGLVAPFFNVYFAEKLHLATPVIGLLFAIASLLSVPASLIGPRLSRRLGTLAAIAVTRFALLPCLLCLMVGSRAPILAMTGFIFRFALIFGAGALDSNFTLHAVQPKNRSLASGLRTGTWNLCWAIGAGGAGQLIDTIGYPTLFLISAVLSSLASVLFVALFGLRERISEQLIE